MLCTPVTPPMFEVQLLKVCAVRFSVAMPPAAGLVSTVAVNCDTEQLTPVVPVAVVKNVALVPDLRPAVTVSPAATFAPPTAPVVRTSDPAALAGAATTN